MAVEATPVAAPAADAAPADQGRTGANAQSPGSSAGSASSPASSGQESRGPDYFREAFNRVRGYTQSARPQEQQQAPQAPPAPTQRRPEQVRSGAQSRPTQVSGGQQSRPGQPAQPATAQPQTPESAGMVTLTREQFARAVQSETDRRLARQQADEAARKAREEELNLRKDDPFEYVRLLEERETAQRAQQQRARETTGYLEQQLHHYDRAILDPIMGALPEKTRESIIKGVKPEGIEGRSELTKQGLKALQSYWQYQGRERAKTDLMKDERFVKEVLARYGGVRAEVEPTPALPPSAARQPTSNEAVNSWLRSASGQTRSARR